MASPISISRSSCVLVSWFWKSRAAVGRAQGIAHCPRLAAVYRIPAHQYPDIGKVALRLKHPVVAIVYRAIVLRDYFKPIVQLLLLMLSMAA